MTSKDVQRIAFARGMIRKYEEEQRLPEGTNDALDDAEAVAYFEHFILNKTPRTQASN